MRLACRATVPWDTAHDFDEVGMPCGLVDNLFGLIPVVGSQKCVGGYTMVLLLY